MLQGTFTDTQKICEEEIGGNMQYKAFMIKYAEIGTKGKNRYIFEDLSLIHI